MRQYLVFLGAALLGGSVILSAQQEFGPGVDPSSFNEHRNMIFNWLRVSGKLHTPTDETVVAVAGLFDYPEWRAANVDEFKIQRYIAQYRSRVIELGNTAVPKTFHVEQSEPVPLGKYDFAAKAFHVAIEPTWMIGGEHFTKVASNGRDLYGITSRRAPCGNQGCPPHDNVYHNESIVVFDNIHGAIHVDLGISPDQAEQLSDQLRQRHATDLLGGLQLKVRYLIDPPASGQQLPLTEGATGLRYVGNALFASLHGVELYALDYDGKTEIKVLALEFR